VRQHGWERATWPASRFVRGTLRSPERRDARCVGPTSAFSRSSYEHSCLVGSRLSRDACAPSATRGYRLLSRQSDSLRRATRSPLLGVLLPKCRTVSRTSDIPVATFEVRHRSRGKPTDETRQDRLSPTRVNDASDSCDPRCLPSFKDPCPAAPFRMPGSGRLQVHGLAAAFLFLTASFAHVDPCESSNARFPSARPVADGNHAFLNPDGACRLLQP